MVIISWERWDKQLTGDKGITNNFFFGNAWQEIYRMLFCRTQLENMKSKKYFRSTIAQPKNSLIFAPLF